jgi:SAM-dependent methyltransferase
LTYAVGPWGAALALAVAATLAGAWVLALATRSTGSQSLGGVGRVLVDLALPALACAGTAIALTRLGLGDGWRGFATVSSAGIAAYLLALLVLGRGDLERELSGAIAESLRRLPGRGAAALRGRARRHRRLRSGAYLVLELRHALADTPRRSKLTSLMAYEQRSDPWGYGSEWGPRHLELTERLLIQAVNEGRQRCALDIGCGEGWVTELLIPRYDEILAVDISSVALDRARLRCGGVPNVRFERWDILDGSALGEFDLVLAMGVLEVFRRPRALRRARLRILEALAPGGHLLVTTTKQNPVIENALWSAPLVRGSRQVDRFLRASGRLEIRAQEESDTHRLTLYRFGGPRR